MADEANIIEETGNEVRASSIDTDIIIDMDKIIEMKDLANNSSVDSETLSGTPLDDELLVMIEDILKSDSMNNEGEQDNSLPAAKAKKPSGIKKIFGKLPRPFRGIRQLLTYKRVAAMVVVVCLCAAAGFFGLRFFIMQISANQGQEEPYYTASPALYNLGGFIKRTTERKAEFFEEGGMGIDEYGNIIGGAQNEAQYIDLGYADYTDYTDYTYNISVIDLLYHVNKLEGQDLLSNYNNHIKRMAERIEVVDAAELAPAADVASSAAWQGAASAEDQGAVSAEVQGAESAEGQGAAYADMQAASSGQATASGQAMASGQSDVLESGDIVAATPLQASLAANPTIPAKAPFPVNVISHKTIDGVLISGNLKLENNSGLVIDNAFFEITLDYIYSGGGASESVVYAYVRGVGLAPGEEKQVSFAAVPPEKGGALITLNSISLAAFETYIDGEQFKVYFDPDQSYLEVLAVGAY